MKTFLARIVLDTDGAIAIVFYNRFIHITGRHFNFSCTEMQKHTQLYDCHDHVSSVGVVFVAGVKGACVFVCGCIGYRGGGAISDVF